MARISVKTGMGGRHGNKGGILARFVIDDTSICFINCHLVRGELGRPPSFILTIPIVQAAGQSHRRQRDRDLVDILEDKAAFSGLASSSPGAYAPGGDGTTVFDHELCILGGDLNYRIDARRENVVAAVATGTFESLLPHDQLLKGLATNQTFRLRSFKEPAITFAPTYKSVARLNRPLELTLTSLGGSDTTLIRTTTTLRRRRGSLLGAIDSCTVSRHC